jgi:AcrR family transcriptional regulator
VSIVVLSGEGCPDDFLGGTLPGVTVVPGTLGPARRRDAEANRQRILAAAADAFGKEGLGVSMVEIARRAGVGNATVHRNYPCKQQLLDELFQEWFARRRAAAELGLADPDPWRGLVGFLEDAFDDMSSHRAAGDLYVFRLRGRERLTGDLDALVQRARSAGILRTGVSTQDVILLMLGIGRTIEITGDVAPQQWRRHLAVVLDGLRGGIDERDDEGAAIGLPGQPLEASALEAAIQTWAQPLMGRDPQPACEPPDMIPDCK